jgi:hypothetical protein
MVTLANDGAPVLVLVTFGLEQSQYHESSVSFEGIAAGWLADTRRY